jgi:hypothetical protein
MKGDDDPDSKCQMDPVTHTWVIERLLIGSTGTRTVIMLTYAMTSPTCCIVIMLTYARTFPESCTVIIMLTYAMISPACK